MLEPAYSPPPQRGRQRARALVSGEVPGGGQHLDDQPVASSADPRPHSPGCYPRPHPRRLPRDDTWAAHSTGAVSDDAAAAIQLVGPERHAHILGGEVSRYTTALL